MSVLLYDPIKTMRAVSDSVLVAFSGGKDSVVTLDLCAKYFDRVEAFFMYLDSGGRAHKRQHLAAGYDKAQRLYRLAKRAVLSCG